MRAPVLTLLDRYKVLEAVCLRGAPASSARVMAAILSFYNSRTGLCNPAARTIARRAGLEGRDAERVVRRAVSDLVNRGFLRVDGRNGGKPGKAPNYRPLIPSPDTDVLPTSDSMVLPTPDIDVRSTEDNDGAEGGQLTPGRADSDVHLTQLNNTNSELGAAAPVHSETEMAGPLRKHGCRIDHPNPQKQAELRAEWREVTKGLTTHEMDEIIARTGEPVVWPSEFKRARAAWVARTGWRPHLDLSPQERQAAAEAERHRLDEAERLERLRKDPQNAAVAKAALDRARGRPLQEQPASVEHEAVDVPPY